MTDPILAAERVETDRLRVLVAAGKDVSDRLSSALAGTDYRPLVTQAESGAAALSTLREEAYDAIVVCHELPEGELSGLDVLSRWRESAGDGIPSVFVADYDRENVITTAIELGADRFLPRDDGSAGWDRVLADAVLSSVETRRTVTWLELTRDEFQSIHETVPVMLTRKDTENRLLTVNEAVEEYLGLPREEIEGRTAWELFPESGDEFYEMDRRVIESGEPVEGEIQQLTTPSGEDRWIKTDAVPYRDDGGEVTGVLIVSEDITELKARELELARQNERLSAFTSVVSHDLRNPLNVAQGHLELAREDCESHHLGAVEDAHERMSDLIDNLLTLAREGDAVTDTEPVDLAVLVEASWANVRTGVATLVTAVDRAVRADESRLKQVFENLLRNAVEHGGRDVTITVGSLEDGFYVEDDGAGVPEHERDEVFEAGYTTAERGSGFGLSIVKEIVEAHGWDVRVEEGADGGARFEITGVEFVPAKRLDDRSRG